MYLVNHYIDRVMSYKEVVSRIVILLSEEGVIQFLPGDNKTTTFDIIPIYEKNNGISKKTIKGLEDTIEVLEDKLEYCYKPSNLEKSLVEKAFQAIIEVESYNERSTQKVENYLSLVKLIHER